jgi:PAS domain-containing protein
MVAHAFLQSLNGSPQSPRASAPASSFQCWKGKRILEGCRSPMLLARYRRWESLAKPGHLPTLKDTYAADEDAALGHAMLLMQEREDFVYLFQGADLIVKLGRDFRGQRLSRIKGMLTEGLSAVYRACIDDAEPVYIHYVAEFNHQLLYWERLLLPIASDELGRTNFVLTYSLPMDDELSILKELFERSSVGMIAAACAIWDEKDLSGARVILMNSRARQILRLPDDTSIGTVKDLGAWFRDRALWTKTRETAEGERNTIHFRERDSGRGHSVTIEPMGRFVVFHLRDLPAEARAG